MSEIGKQEKQPLRIPNLKKHEVIRDLYKALTGEDIGSVVWENMRVERATKMVDSQRKAVKKDPLRHVRVDVMEAALLEVEDPSRPQSTDPMGQVVRNIPIPDRKRKKNQGNNRRKRVV